MSGRVIWQNEKEILETIHICKDRNVLREYLESREKEVVDIMMVLYDQEEAIQMYGESEHYDEKIETARRLIEIGKLSLEDIAAGTGLTIDKVKEIASLQPV